VIRIHYLQSKEFSDSQRFRRFGQVITACGISGVDEGCGEFTELSSGREGRIDYSEEANEITCKRCLAWLKKKNE
jgi:hypothetical protein